MEEFSVEVICKRRRFILHQNPKLTWRVRNHPEVERNRTKTNRRNAEKCENLVPNLHRKMEEILQNNVDKEKK